MGELVLKDVDPAIEERLGRVASIHGREPAEEALHVLRAALSVTGSDPSREERTGYNLAAATSWTPFPGYPERSVDQCVLAGDPNATGLYLTLLRWWPGYMSAPHTYLTTRYSLVLDGTWWVNTKAEFDPASCTPVGAGGFVRRVAGTHHYDGVLATADKPVTIAICGMAPTGYTLVDETQPSWHRV